MKQKRQKSSRKSPRRFMFWRKSVAELSSQKPWYGCEGPTIGTLEQKITEARNLLDQERCEFKEIIIVEIVRVVRRTPAPTEVDNFDGLKEVTGGSL